MDSGKILYSFQEARFQVSNRYYDDGKLAIYFDRVIYTLSYNGIQLPISILLEGIIGASTFTSMQIFETGEADIIEADIIFRKPLSEALEKYRLVKDMDPKFIIAVIKQYVKK